MGVLLLIGLTQHQVHVVQTDVAVVGQRILHEEVAVLTVVLGQLLIGLVQVYTVRLNPGRHPCLIRSVRLAVRQVQLVVQLVVLQLQTNHLEQVNVGRTGSHHAVNERVAGQQVVHQQGVRGRDVTMDGIIVDTVSVSIIVEAAGVTHLVVEHPCRLVVSLDGGLHQQRTTQHVGHVAIQTLHVLRGIRQTHTVLAGVRIDEARTELDELGLHRVVHTCGETLVVRTCALQRTSLLEVVEANVIRIVSTATAEVDVVVLAHTGLEHLVEPVGVSAVHELILAGLGVQRIAAGQRCARVGTGLTQVLAVLVGIHHVVDAAGNLVPAEISLIVNLQGLFLLTALGGDDDHTVSSTRTVDGTCRCILQHLDGLDVVRRDVANSGTHGHTVNHVQRSRRTERTDTTDTHCGVGTGLTVRRNLHAGHLTFQHSRDVRVRHTLQFVGIHNADRTRQVGLLLDTITYDDHLVEHLGVALHLDLLDNGTSADGNLAVFVTHIAHNERRVGRSINREVTVEVGNSTRLSTLHSNSCTNEGFPRLVNNLARDLNGLLGH